MTDSQPGLGLTRSSTVVSGALGSSSPGPAAPAVSVPSSHSASVTAASGSSGVTDGTVRPRAPLLPSPMSVAASSGSGGAWDWHAGGPGYLRGRGRGWRGAWGYGGGRGGGRGRGRNRGRGRGYARSEPYIPHLWYVNFIITVRLIILHAHVHLLSQTCRHQLVASIIALIN